MRPSARIARGERQKKYEGMSNIIMPVGFYLFCFKRNQSKQVHTFRQVLLIQNLSSIEDIVDEACDKHRNATMHEQKKVEILDQGKEAFSRIVINQVSL